MNEASQPGPLVSIARALLIAALVMLAACDIEPGAPPTVIVTQTQVIQPAGGSNTTPGVTPTPLAQRIASVRVGIFAQTCPMGGVVPANGANTIRVGCFAMFTATPKDSSGRELQLPDAAWDAMSVSWAVSGSACNDLDAAQGENRHNRFNREVRGEEAGTCSVCATVEGVGGCAVQPNGDRLVRVVS